jgi:CelD/BcsL family acetyltransferase involved in cellulose biosynthesis/RimJ/RimL family protein N-acetyltransferase
MYNRIREQNLYVSVFFSTFSLTMSIFLARNNQARILLNDVTFQAKWQHLFDNCAWATVFQNPVFLQIWHKHYQEIYELIFVYETNSADEIIGLFPLGFCKSNNELSVAGNYHAEYQTWLATNENANLFITNALDLLQKEFPRLGLRFLFLAPNSPLEWLSEKWGKTCNLREMPRPLIAIGESGKAVESLKKKGNKSRLRQLKKHGEPEFIELKNALEFDEIFDEIENYSKLRLSALHNVKPTFDANRKPFHLDLMRQTDWVYPTVLKVGKEIASAQVCLKNRDEMLLCITAMSPKFAKQSPSKLHLLMLEQEFENRKMPIFDLSPGEGYKDRFATHYDKAHALTVFFDQKDFVKYETKRKITGFVREKMEQLNIRKTKAFSIADRLRHKLKRVKIWTIPRTAAKNIGRKIYEKAECRFYYFEVEKIKNLPNYDFVRRNSIEDLLKFEPTEGWQFTTAQFHQEVLKRFEEGSIAYTFAEDGILLHYGWLLENQKISRVPEVGNAEFHFPPNSAVLFDFYTHPTGRGRKFYHKSLSQMLHIASQIPDVEKVFIGVLADNKPSRHVIEKIGFTYDSSLFMETKLGRTKTW